MKNKLITIIALGATALLSCCSSIKSASLGSGATPGKDYVTSLRPSAAARQYFARIGNKAPIETLTRGNAGRSKSGVRFVANDGILIPAGVTISFTNKGYCMDPKLPAPVADEEYQLVPTSALIPSQLQGIYQNLVKRAAAGDSTVRSNMQSLVWALRTAGTENGYAARLSTTQKRILDSCSSRPGEFERIHNSGLATSRLMNELWKVADSAVNVKVGNRTWKPSDFSSAGALNNAINSQLNTLISQGSKLPIQRTGFNYGELEPGIYTDIRGTGTLAFTAKIANSTNKDFIFYPCNYVGQVGSGSVLSAVSFAAAPNLTQRQRVSMGPIDKITIGAVIGQILDLNSRDGIMDTQPQLREFEEKCFATGKNSIKKLDDIENIFKKETNFNINEHHVSLYSNDGKMYITDTCEIGPTGGTIYTDLQIKSSIIADIHTHPNNSAKAFSAEDVYSAISSGKTQVVYDIKSDNWYKITPEEAEQHWKQKPNSPFPFTEKNEVKSLKELN